MIPHNNKALISCLKNRIVNLFLCAKFVLGIIFLLIPTVVTAQIVTAKDLQEQLNVPARFIFTDINVLDLQQFYSTRNYQPVWLTSRTKSPRLKSALAFIATADAEGLNPNDYSLQQLQQLQLRFDKTASSKIELELRTTQVLLTLIQDLLNGRISASDADSNWHILQQPFDAIDFLLEIADSDNLQQSFNDISLKKLSYQLLKQTLTRYQEFADRNVAWIKIPNVPTIRPGKENTAIPLIRKRIAQAYAIDAIAEYNIPLDKNQQYDDVLVAAIKAFQIQHGLNPDGVIGKNTLQALNTTLAWKIRQLRINMERLRWLPRDLGERYVLVNIAGFRLTAAEQGKHVLNMRIIVGRNYRSTPSFDSSISHMILNPYWNVPASIARKDLLPKQQNDASYFSTAGIKVYSGYNSNSEALDPATIDWHKIKKGFPYVLRQDPGHKNALGTIKFMFANPFNIYLHDTPSKRLFAKDIRTFSSGCIRLEKPMELAAFSLGNQNGLSDRKSKKTVRINLPEPLPIYVVYMTTWVDNQNKVHFSRDIYGRDKRALDYAGW